MLRAKKIFIAIFLIGIVSVAIVVNAYIPNNRDTLKNPKPMEFEPMEFGDHEPFYENETFEYRYSNTTDVLFITDKRNNYTWKSGIDQETRASIDAKAKALRTTLNEQLKKDEISPEDAIQQFKDEIKPVSTMTDSYVNRANSMISVKYFDLDGTTPKEMRLVSADSRVAKQKEFSKDPSNPILKITYDFSAIKFDLRVTVLIKLSSKGFEIEIPDNMIQGNDQNRMAKIEIMPFFGATGGAVRYPDVQYTEFTYLNYNFNNNDLLEQIAMIDGYSFIPDGPGGLVRFQRNSQEFEVISIPVYGLNPTYSYGSYFHEPIIKFASVPVYGMSHGFQQNAYVAYATEGAEGMTIHSAPEGAENNVPFNYTFSEFLYNFEYDQAFNKSGDSYTTIRANRLHPNINVCFNFLHGDGLAEDYSADYIGMAKTYRDYVFAEKELKTYSYDEIPLRLDFLMADSQKSIFGSETIVVTNVHDTSVILEDIRSMGITNMNVGLLGYQSKGLTVGSINKVKWDSNIGKKKEFKSLISKEKALGTEISFMQNYFTINREQIGYVGVASKHVSGWYSETGNFLLPYIEFNGYLQPQKAYAFAKSQINTLRRQTGVEATSISGITDNILSNQNDSTLQGISHYEKLFNEFSDKVKINAVRPNVYLWDYIERYLNADAFNSQYLAVTDTVPFLSFILNGYVEVYADYSNFSFYDKPSMLRMIDYNMYPSFVLTQKSSHYLSRTNSNRYYSTEYSLYKDRIDEIYQTVNQSLSPVVHARWENRSVLENGVILNTYSNGISIVINYKNEPYTYLGREVKPLSSEVIHHG